MSIDIPDTFPVDNAGQIFIPIHSPMEPTISRIAVDLNEEVDSGLLQKAVGIIIKRFPYFQVYLKRTPFKYVFKRTHDIPAIEKDTRWTNRYINFFEKNFLFKVKYTEKTIAVELSHILSDGFGTMTFLMALLLQYFKLKGLAFSSKEVEDIIKPESPLDSEEWECPYRKTFSPEGPKLKFYSGAFIPGGSMIRQDKYFSTIFRMDLNKARILAKEKHATLNVFMAAIYTSAIEKLYFENKKDGHIKKPVPIRIQIPVNLRRYYPTKSLKNFSYVYSPEFFPEKEPLSIDELIRFISASISHERHSGSVENQIARNLRFEENPFFKYAPLFIKDALFRFFYFIFSRNTYSGIITNLGNISLPPTMEKLIDSFSILPGSSRFLGRIAAIYSYKEELVLNIGSLIKDLHMENTIADLLTKLDISYSVEYNRDPD